MKKQEQYKNLFRFGLSFVVWCAVTAIWAVIWMESFADDILRPFGYKGNWLVFAVYGLLLYAFTSFYGGYRIGHYKRGDVIYSSLLALVFCNAVTYLQTCLVAREITGVRPFLLMTLVQAVLIMLWGVAVDRLYTRLFPPREMLMVYSGGKLAVSLIHKMISRSEKYIVREVVDIADGFEAARDKILQYQAVILCDLPAMRRNHILKLCFEKGIRAYITPKLSDILIRGSADIRLFDSPLLLSRNVGLTFEQRLLKRTVDIVFSSVWLLLASPFMLLTALAIKLYDGGPVLFRQTRLTRGGREFSMVKFRSMVVDAERDTGPQLSTQNDERVTPVGRLIRMLRIDELPQLWNILRGDMSVVGPRPERPEIAAEYLKVMPEFNYRLKVKAGLTGYAQIVGRYNTEAYDKLKMDLMYISGYSLLQDFKLMLMTVKILFVKSSTDGVEERPEAETPELVEAAAEDAGKTG